MTRKFLLCLVLSGLTSCVGRRLDIQTTYLTRESLASSIVLTPDPARLNPPIGQRLIVQWNLRKEFAYYKQLSFILTMRFRNHQEQEIKKQLKCKSGTYVFDVLNNAYNKTGGVLTYQLTIYGDNCIIDQWKHPLWAHFFTLEPADQTVQAYAQD